MERRLFLPRGLKIERERSRSASTAGKSNSAGSREIADRVASGIESFQSQRFTKTPTPLTQSTPQKPYIAKPPPPIQLPRSLHPTHPPPQNHLQHPAGNHTPRTSTLQRNLQAHDQSPAPERRVTLYCRQHSRQTAHRPQHSHPSLYKTVEEGVMLGMDVNGKEKMSLVKAV
ncbi:hypothetical protein G7Y79_00015g038000 [Physcia stellaris]|nr:hypothetical protein G7Y79_00015g038000 [Physcia stellaris]